jgi:aminoglycoside 3-N-acetyltransferase I
MSAPIEMRRLGPADVAMVAELNSMFGTAFGEPAVYVGASPGADYLRGVLAKDHVIGLVAVADGVVVGGLVAYELEKLERARSEIYIYDLAVAETFRRRGIATALIRRVQEIARARGAWVVYVQADHGDDPAQALYGKLGAREDVLHFDIPV